MGDFDADGYDDIAIGSAGEVVAGHYSAGGVRILFGGPTGLTTEGAEHWTRATPGIPGEPNYGDLFGGTLATGDFNGDGLADLAVGVWHRGTVQLIYGSPDGLTAEGSSAILTSPDDLLDIGSGDFDGDGDDELVISQAWPVESTHVFEGDPAGIDPTAGVTWNQGTPGVRGLRGDETFGASVAGADMNQDGYEDLVVVVTGDGRREGWARIETVVQTIYGSPDGLIAEGNQRRRFFRLAPESVALYRAPVLRIGDVDGDAHPDVVLGDARADVDKGRGFLDEAGAAIFLSGTRRGVTLRDGVVLSQATRGSADPAEEKNRFGQAVGIADLDADGLDDVAIGIDWEVDTGGLHTLGGAVQLFFGTSAGLTTERDVLWTKDTDGIEGVVEAYDGFGASFS